MRTVCINIAKVGTVLRDLSEHIVMDVFGLLRNVLNVFFVDVHIEEGLLNISWREEGRFQRSEKAMATPL